MKIRINSFTILNLICLLIWIVFLAETIITKNPSMKIQFPAVVISILFFLRSISEYLEK